MSSICRISSLPSNGGVTAALRTRQEKIPRFPSHSNRPLTSPVDESLPAIAGRGCGSGNVGMGAREAVSPLALTCSDLAVRNHARCSDAFVKAESGVRYRRTPGRCSRPYIPASCSSHPECVFGSEAVRVPAINRGHRARIGPHERREREDAMAVCAAARRQGRDYRMAHPRDYASAFTAIVQGIFLQSFRQPITCRGSHRRDREVGAESLAETLSPLTPLWRRIIQLVDAGCYCGAGYWVRSVRVENIIVELSSLRWTCIGEVHLP